MSLVRHRLCTCDETVIVVEKRVKHKITVRRVHFRVSRDAFLCAVVFLEHDYVIAERDLMSVVRARSEPASGRFGANAGRRINLVRRDG